MSTLSDAAAKFEAANEAFIRAVEACPEDRWSQLVPGDQRTVAQVAWHVAWGHEYISERTRAMADGRAVTPPDIDALNAENAAAHPAPAKAGVLAMLRANGVSAANIIRSLTPEGLERAIEIPGRGRFTVADMVNNVLVGHPVMHLKAVSGDM